MKKALVIIIICLLVASNIAFLSTVAASSADKIPVVIGFKNHMDTNAATALVGNINKEFTSINAVSVSLPQQAIDALKKNPNIAYIDNDIQLTAIDQDAELTNSWGVKHIGADAVKASGEGINVAVIDT